MTSIISWVDGKKSCYWPAYEKHDFSFYRKVKHLGNEYEIGSGVYVPGILPNTKDIARIHCLYENPKTVKITDRFRAVIEIFIQPKTVSKLAEEYNIKLDHDIDIIQDGHARFYNIAIENFQGKCHLVFALAKEKPNAVLQHHFKKHKEPTYICRFNMDKIGSKYIFKCVISNEKVIFEEKTPPKANGYRVTSLECGTDSVKLKLTRNSLSTIDNVISPTIRIERINIEELKNTINSPKKVTSIKENIDNDCQIIEDIPKKGRRKQNFTHKMYGTDDIEVEKIDTPKKSQKHDVEVDNMVNKMKKVLGIVTPSKAEKVLTPRKRLPKLAEEIDEPLKKTPRKNSKNNVDIITDVLEANLNIVTPQKTRRRLSELNDDKGDSLKKTKIEEVRRKSSRVVRNTPIKQIVNSDSDNEIKFIKKTPKQTRKSMKSDSPSKRVKVSTLHCEIGERVLNTECSNAFDRARDQLRGGAPLITPNGCLPCREKEYSDIMSFITGKLSDKSGGCMYISGVPGTGKTHTVRQVITELQTRNKFKYVCVNALSLTEPRQLYVEMARQVLKSNIIKHWDEALDRLRAFLTEKRHETHVLVVDELDKLCTRKQDVVYNLLDLPATSKTPIIVITIANTMDLPERLLSNKVNSRLGLTRLTFRPYKHNELVRIVKERLEQGASDVFKGEAVEYAARKVAAVSGDARRALAVCARAAELAQSKSLKHVTMAEVDAALGGMAGGLCVRAVRGCSKTEKILLSAIAHETQRTGNDEVQLCDAVRILNDLCVLESLVVPSVSQLLIAAQRLHHMRLVVAMEGKHDVANTLLLNVSPDDIHYALKNI